MTNYDYPKLDLRQGDIRHNLTPFIGILRLELNNILPDYLKSNAEDIIRRMLDRINEIDTAGKKTND